MISLLRKSVSIASICVIFGVSHAAAQEDTDVPSIAFEIIPALGILCSDARGEENRNYCNFLFHGGLNSEELNYTENLKRTIQLYGHLLLPDGIAGVPDLSGDPSDLCPDLALCREENPEDWGVVCFEILQMCVQKYQ